MTPAWESMKHTVGHLRFPKAPVETVAEFRQIKGQMLRADAMMDTTNVAFDIGDQGMNPRQDLGRLFARTRHEPLMEELQRPFVLTHRDTPDVAGG